MNNNLENDATKVLGAQILFCALACPNSIVTINKKLKNYFEANFEISSEYEISNSLLNETKVLLDEIPNFELEKSSKEKFNNLLTSFYCNIFDDEKINVSSHILHQKNALSAFLEAIVFKEAQNTLADRLVRLLMRILCAQEVVDLCKYINSQFVEEEYSITEVDSQLSVIAEKLTLGSVVDDNQLINVKLLVLFNLPNLYEGSSFMAKQGFAYKFYKSVFYSNLKGNVK